jgi:hypothetical protein
MAGVVCYRPDATDARLAFHLREGAYDTDQLIGVVAALRRLLGGSWPVIVVWDNLPAQRMSRSPLDLGGRGRAGRARRRSHVRARRRAGVAPGSP